MVPAETSPSAVFKKMFLQGTPEEIKRELQSLQGGGSILDHLKEQTTSLQKSASTVDRIKLEQYFDAVRTAENDLYEAGAWLHRPKPKVEIVRSFGDLLEGLSTTSDASGSLLDQTTVIFGSNLGNANSHDTRQLPILVAGGGYSHGQHVKFEGERDTPLSNLFVSVLQWMGVETHSFGQSTGSLTWA